MADVVDLIMKDHREVERMFEQLRTDRASRPGLTPVLTTLLTAHARAEESEVYPAAISEAEEAEEVSHSQAEHHEADELLAELAACDPEGSDYDEVLDKLIESVTHHVEEEESTVLPGMREKLEASRLEELGQAFLDAREEHLGEQPDDISRADLLQQASNLGIEGASSMDKATLKREIAAKAEEEEESE